MSRWTRAQQRHRARARRRRGRRDVGDPRRLDRGGVRGDRPVAVLRRRRSSSRSSATPPSTGSPSTSRARDKMDLSVNIAIGSSAQIALFVAPVLVLLSFFVGPFPMPLVFNGFELGAIAARGPDRQPGHARGRVDLVRGRAAARRLRRAGHRLLLRLMTAAFVTGPGPWLALAGITVALLLVDLKLFARGREPTFREGVVWSIGWLVLACSWRRSCGCSSSADDAVTYTTVYFDRALAVARQPVRLPAPVQLLRGAAEVPARTCCSGASSRRSRCAGWRSSAASR